MTGTEATRISADLPYDEAMSALIPIADFTALSDVPADLGFRAHRRLEDVFGIPVASDDSQPLQGDERTGQRQGAALGEIVGRQREFTQNLPQILTNVKEKAEEKGVTESALWDEITEILIGSGIGEPMHRTIDRPVGGAYGARGFMEKRAANGITLIMRGNIANWSARRQQVLISQLGSMSRRTLGSVEQIIYVGSGRQYKGDELWRPELQPYITGEGDDRVCALTEATAVQELHQAETDALITSLGIYERIQVSALAPEDPGAKGDDLMRLIAQSLGDQIRNNLIIEVGNAPAGYVQLTGALVLAEELGIDPTEQFLTISDGVTIVHPDHFKALTLEQRSKVQNAATALNSLNGWMQTIARVNRTILDRLTTA